MSNEVPKEEEYTLLFETEIEVEDEEEEEEDQQNDSDVIEKSVDTLHVSCSILQNEDELKSVALRFTSGNDIQFLFEAEYDEKAFETLKTDQDLEIDFNDFPNILQEVLEKVPNTYTAKTHQYDKDERSYLRLKIQQDLELCTQDIFTFDLPLATVERIKQVSQDRYNAYRERYQKVWVQYQDMIKRIKRQDPKILTSFRVQEVD